MVETKIATTTDSQQESFHLIARDPQGMVAAQSSISSWCQGKIASLNADVKELTEAVRIAKQSGWKYSALENQLTKAVKQVRFYTKVAIAVDAGLTIIPNFPIDVFAIRVTKEKPKYQRETASYQPSLPDEKPQILDAGKGRYQSPNQLVYTGSFKEKDKTGNELTKYFAETADFSEVAFPILAARPEVMSATAEAMALQVFDQIGICPQSRQGDPLIIGQILTSTGWRDSKHVSFLIAWHLDLRTL